MTATIEATPARVPLGKLPVRRGRVVRDRLATLAIIGSFGLVLVPLIAVIGYVIAKGVGVLDWQFLTTSPIQNRPDQPNTAEVFGQILKFGMQPAVVGTLLITALATALAVPIGVLGGIYLNEYGGKNRLALVLRFFTDCMTGVPSVVMGLFVFTVIVLNTKDRTGFAGAIALAFLMLPVVIRSTEEMLRLVPNDQREASLALGGRKANTIVRIVLPAAAPGIVSGALLAIARAAGETAPLLFVIGITNRTNWNPFSGENTTLSVQTYMNAAQPYSTAVDRAWGAALTLIVIAFAATIIARTVTNRIQARNGR